MDRAALHGGPSRGPSGTGSPSSSVPGYGSQDARNYTNFAVQPPAAPANISVKKTTVKMVRPAGPSTISQSVSSSSSVAAPVAAKPKEADGYVPLSHLVVCY